MYGGLDTMISNFLFPIFKPVNTSAFIISRFSKARFFLFIFATFTAVSLISIAVTFELFI